VRVFADAPTARFLRLLARALLAVGATTFAAWAGWIVANDYTWNPATNEHFRVQVRLVWGRRCLFWLVSS
jgi:hypothetical protein